MTSPSSLGSRDDPGHRRFRFPHKHFLIRTVHQRNVLQQIHYRHSNFLPNNTIWKQGGKGVSWQWNHVTITPLPGGQHAERWGRVRARSWYGMTGQPFISAIFLPAPTTPTSSWEKHQTNASEGGHPVGRIISPSPNCQGHQKQGKSEKLSQPRGTRGDGTCHAGPAWGAWGRKGCWRKLEYCELVSNNVSIFIC